MEEYLARLLEHRPGDMAESLSDVYFSPGDFILKQGERVEAAYLLLEGTTKDYLLTPGGLLYHTHTYREGTLLGEMELMGGHASICSVRAFTPCTTMRLSREIFCRWMEEDREFLQYVFEEVHKKVAFSSHMLGMEISYPLKLRTLHFLSRKMAEGEKYVEKSDIMMGLGAQVRSVDRVVRELCQEGIIEYDSGVVRVIDPQKMQEEIERGEDRYLIV